MQLYSLPLSPFAARVRAALYAQNLDVAVVQAPADWSWSAEYRALNPLGRVPVLVLDDGSTLAESGVIVEYLEDAFPEIPLRPAAPADRARVRFITQVAELYVTGAMMPLFDLFDASLRDDAVIAAQLQRFDGALAQLEQLLRPGRLAFGEAMTTADCWLAPLRFVINGLMAFAGKPALLDAYPAIDADAAVAQGHPHLGRVWREMEDGLKAFMARRAAGG